MEDLREFVEKDYQPPRETEIMVDGSNLRNGMVILSVGPFHKTDLADLRVENPDPRAIFNARKYNRWCLISNVRRIGKGLSFTGEYADGAMYRHHTSYDSQWYVLQDGVRTDTKDRDAKFTEVLYLVNQAFGDIDKAHLRKPPGPMPDARETVEEIFKILGVC